MFLIQIYEKIFYFTRLAQVLEFRAIRVLNRFRLQQPGAFQQAVFPDEF